MAVALALVNFEFTRRGQLACMTLVHPWKLGSSTGGTLVDCTSSLTIPPCGVLFGHPKHLVIAVPHLEDLPGVAPVQASHPPPVLQQPWRTVRGPTPQPIPPVPLRSTVPSFSSPGGRVSSPFGLAVWKPMGTSSVLGSPRPNTTLAPEGGKRGVHHTNQSDGGGAGPVPPRLNVQTRPFLGRAVWKQGTWELPGGRKEDRTADPPQVGRNGTG
eukprot:scaffold610_cov352-Pavlova_lutheri.AAC.10